MRNRWVLGLFALLVLVIALAVLPWGDGPEPPSQQVAAIRAPVAATVASGAMIEAPAASVLSTNPVPPTPPVTTARPSKSSVAIDAPTVARVGEVVTVNINASIPNGASNFSFTLRYDPTVWKLQDTTEGSFLKNANGGAYLRTDSDPDGGNILATMVQDGGPPIEGNGSLVVFTFQAIAPSTAQSRMQLSQISLTSANDADAPALVAREALTWVNP